MPKSIDVELASLVKHVPEGDRWFHEIKFDGYRILAFKDKDRVRLISRNGKDWTERFSDIERSVAALPAAQAILDGEVVVLKPDGSTSFQALQNFARQGEPTDLTYMVFDLLYLDGTDLRGAALEDRKPLLEALVSSRDGQLRYTDHIEGRGDVCFEQACTHSREGVVSKRRDAPYRSGRSKDWAKTKCLQEQEFVVVGYTDPGGTRSAFGALVLAVHDNGDLKHVGRVGTGFSDASLADIHARLMGIERKEAPVVDPPAGAQAASIHWVEPTLVAEVSFTEWTQDGHLRHPAFRGLREDKPADQVIAEEPVELPDTIAEVAEEPRASSQGDRPLVAGVSLSNPDRLFWPDVGITKLELAHYYESIAELMLPHVAHRPLSLVRCPSGYTGECFYQKHVSHFPKAVGTVAIHEPDDSETVPYAKITGLPSIVGLVQMGVLEIHPWGSRADDPDRPDRLVFDLDPDTELPWKTVAGTALLIRSELSRLGLDSWLKTTGGKGLHVMVPIVRRPSWTEVRDFSKAFVDHIVSLEPGLFTASMSKSQRGGKIFIDYVRNTRGATAVAVYGARARPGAPVSVPLYWEEAESARERPEFTVRNLSARLDTLGGDPWADLTSKRQSLTKGMRSRLGV
ncbi:MAG: DNA ligase D [Gemmatimonadales bacterium]|nr:MAG: DNA ligase D [Gemmatimonadales bacterium]